VPPHEEFDSGLVTLSQEAPQKIPVGNAVRRVAPVGELPKMLKNPWQG
jgi:hypothetical protein